MGRERNGMEPKRTRDRNSGTKCPASSIMIDRENNLSTFLLLGVEKISLTIFTDEKSIMEIQIKR